MFKHSACLAMTPRPDTGTDVDHEVEPVTSGTRVTLTWLLRRADAAKLAPPVAQASESDFEAVLIAALEDPAFLPVGGTLGFPCVHLYAEVPGLVRPADSLSQSTAGRLKGRDGVIARAALRASLQTRYRPYLFETSADEAWRLARTPTGREATIFRDGRLGASDLEASMPIERHCDWDSPDDVTWVLPPPWRAPAKGDSSRDAVPATHLVGELEYSATDYFGNEADEAAFYVSATWTRWCWCFATSLRRLKPRPYGSSTRRQTAELRYSACKGGVGELIHRRSATIGARIRWRTLRANRLPPQWT